MKRVLCGLSVAFLVACVLLPAAPVAAQDQGSVLDEILDILRRGGQITEDQQQDLRERARREEQGRILAGIDENLKPFLRSANGDFRLELGGFVQFDFDAVQGGAQTRCTQLRLGSAGGGRRRQPRQLPRRHAAGETPMRRLNARLNAASDS